MKSEYTKKAEQLMKTLNITYTIEYDGIGINPNRNDKDKRTMYSVHLENSRSSMDFTFWVVYLKLNFARCLWTTIAEFICVVVIRISAMQRKVKLIEHIRKNLKGVKSIYMTLLLHYRNTKLVLSQISVINMDIMRTVAEQKGYISPVQTNIISSRRCSQKKKWKC